MTAVTATTAATTVAAVAAVAAMMMVPTVATTTPNGSGKRRLHHDAVVSSSLPTAPRYPCELPPPAFRTLPCGRRPRCLPGLSYDDARDACTNPTMTAPKAVGVEENGEKLGVRRNVDPLCGYASNPYHKCTDFCTRRNLNQKSSSKGASFIPPFMAPEGRKERLLSVNTNNVNPSCSYASNPYHQCTKNCSQRTKELIEIKQGKPGIAAIVRKERSSRGVGVTERKNVDPRCKYALNPYHKCTSSCSQKFNQVA